MSLRNFAVHSALNPCQGINYLVVPFFHQLHSKGQLGINGPDEKKPVLLQFFDGNFLNFLIPQTVVLNGNTSRWLGCAELPWRVHHDHIEHPHSKVHLAFDQLIPVEMGDISTDWNRVIAHMGLFPYIIIRLPFFSSSSVSIWSLKNLILSLTFLNRAYRSWAVSGSRSTMAFSS